jgi:hypothetical protein
MAELVITLAQASLTLVVVLAEMETQVQPLTLVATAEAEEVEAAMSQHYVELPDLVVVEVVEVPWRLQLQAWHFQGLTAVQGSLSSAGLQQLHLSSQDLHLTRSQLGWLKHLRFPVHLFLHSHVVIDGKFLAIPEQHG